MGGKRTLTVAPRMSLRKSVITGPRQVLQVGRNDACPCGSGKKYKDCHVTEGDHWLRKMAEKLAKEEAKRMKAEAKAAK
ncbi:MAG: SEC-C domain-containing protein [Deltaproteobacteria bacterium]|nr:SEC-C domain-containing protein [Deltaproteobacteria bacterium]